jgi:uncharacterized membrane protein YeaQ/YmgE (transglycosylase-associated protein family)
MSFFMFLLLATLWVLIGAVVGEIMTSIVGVESDEVSNVVWGGIGAFLAGLFVYVTTGITHHHGYEVLSLMAALLTAGIVLGLRTAFHDK